MKISKKYYIIACAIFALIFVNYLLKTGPFRTIVPLDTYANDDVRYLHSAKTLLEAGRFTYFTPEKSTLFMMPGIVFAMVPFVAMFGEVGAILAFKIFQCLLQFVCIFVLGKITLRATKSSSVANITMIIYAQYLPNAITANYLYTETLFTTMILTLIYLTMRAFDVDSKKGDNMDSPEEISFPYKLREIKLYLYKIDYQTRYHKIVNDTLAASDKI